MHYTVTITEGARSSCVAYALDILLQTAEADHAEGDGCHMFTVSSKKAKKMCHVSLSTIADCKMLTLARSMSSPSRATDITFVAADMTLHLFADVLQIFNALARDTIDDLPAFPGVSISRIDEPAASAVTE